MAKEKRTDLPPGVSPISGTKIPQGRKFTKENAKEMAMRSRRNVQNRNSIKKAFLDLMSEQFEIYDEKGQRLTQTGAEIVARSIITGAGKNNARMVEIALSLLGEKPKEEIDVSVSAPNFAELDEAFAKLHDGIDSP